MTPSSKVDMRTVLLARPGAALLPCVAPPRGPFESLVIVFLGTVDHSHASHEFCVRLKPFPVILAFLASLGGIVESWIESDRCPVSSTAAAYAARNSFDNATSARPSATATYLANSSTSTPCHCVQSAALLELAAAGGDKRVIRVFRQRNDHPTTGNTPLMPLPGASRTGAAPNRLAAHITEATGAINYRPIFFGEKKSSLA
jgi:hypothetical protein